MRQSTALSHTTVRGWIADALEMFITKDSPRKRFAHKIDCSVSAIDNYRNHQSTPSLPIFLAMCKALGPEFVNFMLAKIGMTGARWIEAGQKCHRSMHHAIAELNSVYTECWKDGVIDADEERQLKLHFMNVNARSAAYLAN